MGDARSDGGFDPYICGNPLFCSCKALAARLRMKDISNNCEPFSASSAYHLEPPGSACSGMNGGSFTRHPPQNLASGEFNSPHFALPHNMGFDPSPETAASGTVQLNSSRGRIGGVYATARSLSEPCHCSTIPINFL